MKLNLSYWKLVGFALLIALPASFFIAGKILQEYPYRVEIDLWIFVGLGFAVLLLVTTAISFKTYKAACSNPLRSINEE